MLNRDAQVIQNTKTQYDVTIEPCTVQKFSAKICLQSDQTTKIHKNYNLVTIKYFKIYCVLRGAFHVSTRRFEFAPLI